MEDNRNIKEVVVNKEERFQFYKISELDEMKDIYSYKLEILFNKKVIYSDQGITTISEIANFTNTGIFKNNFGFELVDINMVNKALREKNIRHIPEKCYISKPYTKNIKFDKNKHALIKDRISYNGTVEDFLGSYITVGVLMDYMNGNVSESHYDLEKLLIFLKNRNDIVFVNDAKIEQIPYYNNEEGRSETINFTWYPNEEDYNKCILDDGRFRPELALTKVFGIERKDYKY